MAVFSDCRNEGWPAHSGQVYYKAIVASARTNFRTQHGKHLHRNAGAALTCSLRFAKFHARTCLRYTLTQSLRRLFLPVWLHPRQATLAVAPALRLKIHTSHNFLVSSRDTSTPSLTSGAPTELDGSRRCVFTEFVNQPIQTGAGGNATNWQADWCTLDK